MRTRLKAKSAFFRINAYPAEYALIKTMGEENMFVYSVRASGLRFFAILFLSLAVLVGIMISGSTVFASAQVIGEVDFSGIKTEEDRVHFLKQFGIEVKTEGAECAEFVMPENFDRVMMGYNEIQRTQGLDLAKYARKKVTRYTYEVVDYEGYDGKVLATLLVYRNRVIGCDLSTADPEGFVKPIVTGL